jgi:hypothetical protein
MSILIPLITIFAGACLIALWPNFRRASAAMRPGGGVLKDVDLGYAQLTLPRGWRQASGLNEASPLQAVDPIQGRYVLVLSESRADFESSVDLYEHSTRTRDILGQSVRLLAIRGPQERSVGGYRAVQYELDATYDSTFLTYLHTTIEGRRAFHQVLGWATYSRYDRNTFERLLDDFVELPGPDLQAPAFASSLPRVIPSSRYEIH